MHRTTPANPINQRRVEKLPVNGADNCIKLIYNGRYKSYQYRRNRYVDKFNQALLVLQLFVFRNESARVLLILRPQVFIRISA